MEDARRERRGYGAAIGDDGARAFGKLLSFAFLSEVSRRWSGGCLEALTPWKSHSGDCLSPHTRKESEKLRYHRRWRWQGRWRKG